MKFLFKQPQFDREVIYMDLSTYIDILKYDKNLSQQINETYYTLYSPELKLELDEMLHTAPSEKEIFHQNIDTSVTKITKDINVNLSKRELLGEDISQISDIEILGESQQYVNQKYSKGIYTDKEIDISKKTHQLKKSDNQYFQNVTTKSKPFTIKQLQTNAKARIKSQFPTINNKILDKLLQECISNNEDELYVHKNNDPPTKQIKDKIQSVFNKLHFEFINNRDIIEKIASDTFVNRIKTRRIEPNSIDRFLRIMYYHFMLNPDDDEKYHEHIYKHWIERNCPPIIEFAPYTDYITKIYMATSILSQNRLIKTGKKSHVFTDTNYLTYLPYCNIFVTQDEQQKTLAKAIIEAAQLNVEVKTYKNNKIESE